MRTLYFVTSNPNKYKEVAEILKPHGIQVEWANIKLKEIQSNDIDEITKLEHLIEKKKKELTGK